MASKYQKSLLFIANICESFRNTSSEDNPINTFNHALGDSTPDIHPSIITMWHSTVHDQVAASYALRATENALEKTEKIIKLKRSSAADRIRHVQHVKHISQHLLQLNHDGDQMQAAGQEPSTNIDWLFEQSLWQFRHSQAGLTLYNILRKDAILRVNLDRSMMVAEIVKKEFSRLKELELVWLKRWYDLEKLVEKLAKPLVEGWEQLVEAGSLGADAVEEVEASYEALEGIVDRLVGDQ